ncbi:DegT/DnrJ/EryC1/StrS family aminotransferase [Cognatazoarcus halotolerans]|uniref:DegT/DnrJ/EryC1/StrS family aminotransferase n=1 Tax=Cognatazoarcus halotolerans TaxID=2686016 RepID=UPI00135C297C|nr:DegT/DnrJ/EryC1/StrS aminotransferase family protein [Cognatazoarcus halotolerans]
MLGGEPISTERPPRWPCFDESDLSAVAEHMRREELSAYEVVSGPLFEMERELRERFQCEHALLVNSCTAALYSALFGLGLRPGEEIVVPAITYPGTAAVALHLGLVVRFADVDPETGNPGLPELRNAMTERTRAVVLAHAWGLPPALHDVVPYLDRRGIPLIEDAARAFGTRCGGREVGSIGAVGCLSFHELKAVPAGEGGVLLTSDRRVYERAVALGHYFRCKDPHHLSLPDLLPYRHSSLGLNLKIHTIAACVARRQLARLDARLEAMAENHALLGSLIGNEVDYRMQRTPPWAERVSRYGFNLHWRPTSRGAPSVATVVRALRAEGIHASTVGSPPLFRLPLFREPERSGLPGRVDGPREDADFPGATEHATTLLRLPTLFSRNPEWIARYAAALGKIYQNLNVLGEWERGQSGDTHHGT